MKKGLVISLLFIFGILYSVYLSIYSGIFIGLIFILLTIGFTTTIYALERKMDYRIIIYIWVGIVSIAVVGFIINGMLQLSEILKSPLSFK